MAAARNIADDASYWLRTLQVSSSQLVELHDELLSTGGGIVRQ
jgi:hypothetical protein